uniref:Uncharacterized protein n=1 Tax=Palpitomonas bilix TaxID=652834 RepID=A0A7S3D763_9EUKA|mmetsp:Transcript_25285/g.63419  ORF Transcript_25285/g.63419 Transcript_25285/m.63419 type:complete len:111 (+) Transcript_25285:290-622(+)
MKKDEVWAACKLQALYRGWKGRRWAREVALRVLDPPSRAPSPPLEDEQHEEFVGLHAVHLEKALSEVEEKREAEERKAANLAAPPKFIVTHDPLSFLNVAMTKRFASASK